MTFGPTPAPVNAPTLPGGTMIPVMVSEPQTVGQVAIQPTVPTTPPNPFLPQQPMVPAGPADYVSQLRNRLAWLEGQLLMAASYKQEVAMLRKMLAPVKRQPRGKVVRLKVAK